MVVLAGSLVIRATNGDVKTMSSTNGSMIFSRSQPFQPSSQWRWSMVTVASSSTSASNGPLGDGHVVADGRVEHALGFAGDHVVPAGGEVVETALQSVPVVEPHLVDGVVGPLVAADGDGVILDVSLAQHLGGHGAVAQPTGLGPPAFRQLGRGDA